MANAQPSVASPLRASAVAHLHAVGEVCPLCEQPIPHERAEEIAERLEARERERSDAITARLTERFETAKLEALEAARLEADQKIATARDEAREATEAQLQTKVDRAEQARVDALAALQAKTDEAETAKTEAQAAQAVLRGDLDQAKRAGAAALEALRAEAAEKETAIRADAVREANAAVATRMEEITAQKAEAEQAGARLKALLEETRQSGAEALAAAQAEADDREAAAREAAEAEARERVAGAETAKADAEAKAAAAEAQITTLQQAHPSELEGRLEEQRLALEEAKTQAVNVEKAAAFEERQRWSNKVEDLQRQIDRKTAEELGEGAEVDLFEGLKAAFPEDKIARVGRGNAGADIIHTVVHNGRECGKIIYDAKNHGQWRWDFVTKLKADQLSEKADHAILSTRKLPAEAHQLHVKDGVIIANPARVVTLAEIVRAHLVHTHTLRMSSEARAQKTAALYAFITSQPCADMFARLDQLAESLLDIQVKEMKAHEKVWKDQGIAIRTAMRVQAELRNQIDSIIGTASAPETE
jgi:hypothetical protein